MKKLLLVTSAIAIMSSCTPMKYVDVTEQVAVQETSVDYCESTARLLDTESNMLVMPIIANLQVSDTKIIHVEREAFANIKVNNSSIAKIDSFKRTALGRAAKMYNADILVNADIEVVTENGHFVITVTGYPAQYKNFRNVTTTEINIINEANKVRKSASMTFEEKINVQVEK